MDIVSKCFLKVSTFRIMMTSKKENSTGRKSEDIELIFYFLGWVIGIQKSALLLFVITDICIIHYLLYVQIFHHKTRKK